MNAARAFGVSFRLMSVSRTNADYTQRLPAAEVVKAAQSSLS